MSKWIDANDSLPNKFENVLIYSDEVIEIGNINQRGDWVDFLGYEVCRVTHWMPIPNPPKKSQS